MKMFRYVFYGIINVKLSGHLHVGGEDEAMFSMVTDGDGEYILPAGTIAGVIRKGVSSADPALAFLFGDKDHESVIWFFDSPLSNVSVEKRSGTRIDSSTGTAVGGSLHTMYFIGDGAETCDVATGGRPKRRAVFPKRAFRPEWNLVRITRRGSGDLAESLSSTVEHEHFMFIVR